MSEEKTSVMNVNIGKRVRNYLIFFAILILFLIWSEQLMALVTASLIGDKDTAELSRKIISSVLTVIGAITLIILNFGRDIDFHNWLDRKLFHVRQKTGDVICENLIEAAKVVKANGANNMDGKRKEVMYLFYHFANEQKVLRDLAFTYWEQYFVNIYIITFSALTFLTSTIISIIRWKLEFVSFIPLVFLIVGVAVCLQTRFSLVRKIYDLPKQQIEEIKSSKRTQFKKEIKARFT